MVITMTRATMIMIYGDGDDVVEGGIVDSCDVRA